MEEKKKRRIVIITAVLVIGTIIASTIGMFERSKYSAIVEIAVAPLKATLTLNGKEYKNGTHHLLPGTYEVSLTADGFEPYTATIEASAGTATYLYHYLTGPGGDISYYYSHDEDMRMFMTITNYEAGQKAKTYAEKDDVFTITPYYDINKNHFTIQAGIAADESVYITVNLNTCTDLLKDEYSNEAMAYLRGQGIELEQYSVEYIGICD